MGNAIDIGGSVSGSVFVIGNGNIIVQPGAAPPSASSVWAGTWPPRYEFDRYHQKQALEELLAAAAVAIVPLYGPAGQGHGLVADYLRQELQRRNRVQRQVRIPNWPRGARPNACLGELCELLANAWLKPTATASSARALVELVERGAAERPAELGPERLLVHHSILIPTHGDVALVGRYLEEVWRPMLACAKPFVEPTLIFDLLLTRRGGFTRRLYRKLKLADEGAAIELRAMLSTFAASVRACLAHVPELLPLSQDELTAFYPRPSAFDPLALHAEALSLYRATRGNFDEVVAQLFPLEAT